LIFVLVFVSRVFEVGTNVSCEELTVSPVRANLFCCVTFTFFGTKVSDWPRMMSLKLPVFVIVGTSYLNSVN